MQNLGPNSRAMAIRVDAVTAVGGFVTPGDNRIPTLKCNSVILQLSSRDRRRSGRGRAERQAGNCSDSHGRGHAGRRAEIGARPARRHSEPHAAHARPAVDAPMKSGPTQRPHAEASPPSKAKSAPRSASVARMSWSKLFRLTEDKDQTHVSSRPDRKLPPERRRHDPCRRHVLCRNLGIVALSFDLGRVAATQVQLQSHADLSCSRSGRACMERRRDHPAPTAAGTS